jgi:hypothetical protein
MVMKVGSSMVEQAAKTAKRAATVKHDLEAAHRESEKQANKKVVPLGTNKANPWGASHYKPKGTALHLHNDAILKAGLEMATAAHAAVYAAATAQAALKEMRRQLYKKQIIVMDTHGANQVARIEHRRRSSGLGAGASFGMINRMHKMGQRKMKTRSLALIGWRNFYKQAEEEADWDLMDLAQHCCAELNDKNDPDWSHRKIVMDLVEEHLTNIVHTGNKVIDKLTLAHIDTLDGECFFRPMFPFAVLLLMYSPQKLPISQSTNFEHS